MLCVPAVSVDVVHVAVRVLPLPASATAAQPTSDVAPSLKLMVPVGATPVTEAVNVTLAPNADGVPELARTVDGRRLHDLRKRSARGPGIAGVAAVIGHDTVGARGKRCRGTSGGAHVAAAGERHGRAAGDGGPAIREVDSAGRRDAGHGGREGDAGAGVRRIIGTGQRRSGGRACGRRDLHEDLAVGARRRRNHVDRDIRGRVDEGRRADQQRGVAERSRRRRHVEDLGIVAARGLLERIFDADLHAVVRIVRAGDERVERAHRLPVFQPVGAVGVGRGNPDRVGRKPAGFDGRQRIGRRAAGVRLDLARREPAEDVLLRGVEVSCVVVAHRAERVAIFRDGSPWRRNRSACRCNAGCPHAAGQNCGRARGRSRADWWCCSNTRAPSRHTPGPTSRIRRHC